MNPMILNTSSGYESASNDSSLSASSIVQTEQQSMLIKDYQIKSNDKSINDDKSNYRSKTKRRILSHLQREEANRRERQRMEMINQAYENLRNMLPVKKGRKRQKMSRVDAVDGAIRYIQSLLNTLNGNMTLLDF